MSKETSLARDLAVRAFHTAYQAAAATFGVLWAQSDLHVTDLAHGNGWARLYSSVIVGVLAAVVSALKTAGVGYLASRRAKLLADAERAIVPALPKLQADLEAGDVAAAIRDLEGVAVSAEPAVIADLQPTSVDGAHPAAADPDNQATA